jgi:hypothetical protein
LVESCFSLAVTSFSQSILQLLLSHLLRYWSLEQETTRLSTELRVQKNLLVSACRLSGNIEIHLYLYRYVSQAHIAQRAAMSVPALARCTFVACGAVCAW